MMAFVYREKRRRPIPDGAEIIRRRGSKVARWVSGGRTFTADVDGDSVIIEGRVYYARWRGADGRIHTASTGCHDKGMAETWLSRKADEAERIQAGVITQTEADTADKSQKPIVDVLEIWGDDLKAKGRTAQHIRECKHIVENAAKACGWNRLRDMDRISFEGYLKARRESDDISARTFNKTIALMHSFGRWCQRRGMLMMNPFESIERLNQKMDRRYERRTLTTAEVSAIIEAARTRAADAWKGENRAVCYRLMASSGLRWREARDLRLSDIHLESKTPYIELRPEGTKNRKGGNIPLHAATAAALVSFIDARKKSLTGDSGASIVTFPGVMMDAPLFDALPREISRVFAADVKAAGLKSPDASGKVIDAHCLRYHFASELARAGCPVHKLQKLMRHSTVDLSMRVYVHSTLDDLADAVSALPEIGGDVTGMKQAAEAAADTTSHTTLNPTLVDVNLCPKRHFIASTGEDGVCDGTEEKQAKTPVNTGFLIGGRGGNRTRIPSRGTDFKSVVYDAIQSINTGVNDDGKADTTLNPTLDDAKTSHLDAIRETLSGLSKDDIITLLMDALGGDGR